jgi:predicted acyltransferase
MDANQNGTNSKSKLYLGLPKDRVISVDAFRGFAIIGMIVVHVHLFSAGSYSLFINTEWNGANFADMIMPFFLFIVGVSVVLSYSLKSGYDRRTWLVLRALFRSTMLFLIGIGVNLIISTALHQEGIRFMGVLQRIAFVYFACVLLYLFFSWKSQIAVGVLLLFSYWLVMTMIPMMSQESGILEPGKNLAHWIDSRLIPGTLDHGTWDSEGFLTTFHAIVTGISGMLAGYILISKLSAEKKVNSLFVSGFLSFVLGHAWNLSFPFNKLLWTSSFVLYTSGLAYMLLAAFTWLIDIMEFRKWSHGFVILGRQALFTYVFHILLLWACIIPLYEQTSTLTLVITGLDRVFPIKLASLIFSFVFILVCYAVVSLLHWKKIYIRI